jgi:hypothetical protein
MDNSPYVLDLLQQKVSPQNSDQFEQGEARMGAAPMHELLDLAYGAIRLLQP